MGQLRLALKENREAARASEEALDEWKSPVGLKRMALASLQAEALRRGIPTESPSRPSKMKVREELIRDINLHVAQFSLGAMGQSTSTSGRATSNQTEMGPTWMDLSSGGQRAAAFSPFLRRQLAR